MISNFVISDKSVRRRCENRRPETCTHGGPIKVSESVKQTIETKHLMERIMERPFSGIVAFLRANGAGSDAEGLAINAVSKVWHYVDKHPCPTLEHAKVILRQATTQVLIDYFSWVERQPKVTLSTCNSEERGSWSRCLTECQHVV
jgi:hypothetical protein